MPEFRPSKQFFRLLQCTLHVQQTMPEVIPAAIRGLALAAGVITVHRGKRLIRAKKNRLHHLLAGQGGIHAAHNGDHARNRRRSNRRAANPGKFSGVIGVIIRHINAADRRGNKHLLIGRVLTGVVVNGACSRNGKNRTLRGSHRIRK